MVKLTPEAVTNAAEVLEAVSLLYEYSPDAAWSPTQLREELPHISATLEQELLLDEVAKKLIAGLNAAQGGGTAERLKDVLRQYVIDRNPYAYEMTVKM